MRLWRRSPPPYRLATRLPNADLQPRFPRCATRVASVPSLILALSESQERMLIAVPPEKLSEAERLLDRYEVGHAVIGRFTESHRLEATWRGRKVVDLEMSFLWGACPI